MQPFLGFVYAICCYRGLPPRCWRSDGSTEDGRANCQFKEEGSWLLLRDILESGRLSQVKYNVIGQIGQLHLKIFAEFQSSGLLGFAFAPEERITAASPPYFQVGTRCDKGLGPCSLPSHVQAGGPC